MSEEEGAVSLTRDEEDLLMCDKTLNLTCDEEVPMAEDTPLINLACDETMESGTITPFVDSRASHDPFAMLMYEEGHQAEIDPTILNDPRVLPNMLKAEERCMPSVCYFKIIQQDITPVMRSSVATWMYEVCESEKMPETVFLRAMNYVDRFLSVQKIERSQFQLLGAACMLISSKWTGSLLTTDKLIFYTANSITLEMLLEWEMMILAQFKWDIYTLTPSDFVEHILHRLPPHLWNATRVREKAKTFIAYCATDHNFTLLTPSMIASASIASGIVSSNESLIPEVLKALKKITNIETDVLRASMEQLKDKIKVMMENLGVPGQRNPGEPHCSTTHHQTGSDKLGELEQAETPTDVGDIQF